MKVVITGSLGNVSLRLAEKLIAAGHELTIVSHHPAKKADIQQLGAKAAIGSVESLDFLTETFKGADAVYTMIPSNFAVSDYKGFSITVRENYAKAVQQLEIRQVVNLSSVGAALAGTYPLNEYENMEKSLDRLPGVNVLHLRPGGFYTNFYGNIPLLKYQGIIGNNFAESIPMFLTHPHDIADAAFEALHSSSITGINIKYILSDKLNGKEVAGLLGAAIGKKEVHWACFTDEELLDGLVQNGFSEQAAQHYVVDAGTAIKLGIIEQHYALNKHEVIGKRKFAEFAKEFAVAYHSFNKKSS